MMQGPNDQRDPRRPRAAFDAGRGTLEGVADEAAMRAAAEFEDFQQAEAVFLRERAERPYADVLGNKLARLDEHVRRLRQLAGVTLEEYASDWMMQCAVERTLERAIETSISLTRHTIAERRLRAPATLAETFVIARDAGLLEPALAAALIRMCGFRNRLVHDDEHLDPAIVVEALRTRLDDFVELGSVARGWMTARNPVRT